MKENVLGKSDAPQWFYQIWKNHNCDIDIISGTIKYKQITIEILISFVVL